MEAEPFVENSPCNLPAGSMEGVIYQEASGETNQQEQSRDAEADAEADADACVTISLFDLLNSDFLQCPLCKDVYQYPCILPCVHSFCGKCIDNDIKDEISQRESSDKRPEIIYQCRLCNESHQVPNGGFPCNHFLLNLSELYRAQKSTDRQCNYCQYENNISPAVTRCLECEDDLCNSCSAAHKKTKITRGHRLAPFDQIKLGKYDQDIRLIQGITCYKHTLEKCTRYCKQCLQFICEGCRHDKTHQVIAAGRITINGKKPLLLKNILQGKLPTYEEHLKDIQTREGALTEREKIITDRIKQRAKIIHSIVEEEQRCLLEGVSAYLKKEQQTISENGHKLKTTISGHSSSIEFLEALSQHGKKDELVDLLPVLEDFTTRVSKIYEVGNGLKGNLGLSCETTDEDCKELLKSMMGKLHVKTDAEGQDGNTQNVEQNQDSHASITDKATARKMGGKGWSYREEYTQEISVTAKPVLEFDSRTPMDKNNVWPTGVCTVPCGDIVICDRDNAMVKIFSPSGKFKDSFTGHGNYKLIKPFDVTSLSNGELVVSDYGSESVKVFNIDGTGKLIISGDFEYPRGVAATEHDLIAVLDSELGRVTIHDPSNGEILKTITGTTPLNNLIDPYYICVSINGDVLVTDFAEPNIKLLSLTGEPTEATGEYGVTKRQGLLQPYGCCQDFLGLTLIADNRNDKISVIGPNGKFQKHLITRKDGLWQPIALCVDRLGRLIVTEGLGKIKIFNYL